MCLSVYVDGTDIYEVGSEGVVVSVLQKAIGKRYRVVATVPVRLTPIPPRCRVRSREERSGRNMARQSRQATLRAQDRLHMPSRTENAPETLAETGETQIVVLADFHGRFDDRY